MNKILKTAVSFTLALGVAFSLVACGDEPEEKGSLTYTGSTLAAAMVGEAYTATVATATGADAITYTLKSGSALPAGLALAATGAISGTPTTAVSEAQFTVTASAKNYNSADATFKLTVTEAGSPLTLTYTGSTLTPAKVGEEYTGTVATATGADGITYALKTGSTLPAGLELAETGAISGTPTTAVSEAEFTVTASAANAASANATFKITVEEESNRLTFADFAADSGVAGRYYTAMLNKASGADGITYAVSSDTSLPAGLALLPTGFLYGTTTAQNAKFKIVASAEGFDSATAEVSLSIRRAAGESDAAGDISGFSAKTVSDPMVGVLYAGLSSAAGSFATAKASNENVVTYALKEGEEMPEGLTLYPNGTVYGTPATAGSTRVQIVASAKGCADKTARITFNIKEPAVPYNTAFRLEQATVGTAYSASVKSTVAPAGVDITYAVTAGTKLPAGLTLAADGTISGTPTASARTASFGITATAEGYSPAEASVTLAIKDKVTEIANGRMEAEYVDLTGKTGSGYSGSASQEEMVQNGTAYAASNNAYVGYSHQTGWSIEFVFEASAADTGVKFEIGLAYEGGTQTFTPDAFGILLNGEEVNYGSFAIKGAEGGGGGYGQFATFTVSNGVALKAGRNTVTLTVRANTFNKGGTAGPGIDFIQFTTRSTLTWTPCTYNTARFN